MLVHAAADVAPRHSDCPDPLTWLDGPHRSQCPVWSVPGDGVTETSCECRGEW